MILFFGGDAQTMLAAPRTVAVVVACNAVVWRVHRAGIGNIYWPAQRRRG